MKEKAKYKKTIQILPPTSLTLLTTFKCTAKCRNCCFQCSPKASKKMSLSEMKMWLDKCFSAYPSIQLVVFSGGECTLLGNDLVEIIDFVSKKNKRTRIVTNAWWAKSFAFAKEFLSCLYNAGLDEVNFSTGDEHQEWIPFSNIRNASIAALKCGMKCAINIETHDDSKFLLNNYFSSDKEFASLCSNMVTDDKIYVENGVWAPINKEDEGKITYEQFKKDLFGKPCINLFDNIPINPYGEVLACCGITSETNPYMRLGNIMEEDIKVLYEYSFSDILKIWLFVSGPIEILQYIVRVQYGKNIKPVGHMCVICREIFANSDYLETLQNHVDDFAPVVLLKYNLIVKQKKKIWNILK
jgi:MoaA/NifB/PqqE/SkfB family radical SAM enzyme